ncbi:MULTISPECIES: hypothetical protein [unclassified Spirosoma]|uniref:hypothetical protein n=1 Tax=unclassified Spirosoma TaxID=2621999 RepID=UPI0009606B35|nr:MULTISPECIES: hypothetical protein [unclassified Spirosoma]MBN8825427.1 hypothetical protein [Spirosoma sp.]OJW74938.1 MAG: hypothetical protein BGO59_05420 [Spirosoma sp. 48-14]
MITPFRIGWLLLSLTLYTLIGYGVARPQFNLLIVLYGLSFWGYVRITRPLWFVSNQPSLTSITQPEPDRFLVLAAILFRLSLLAVIPNLSDDYVRFIWDGHLVANGFNPYLYLPSQIIHTPLAVTVGLTDSLYYSLNSPNYYTVYPPVNQVLFGLAAFLSPHHLLGNVIGLRIPILLAEIGTLWLLPKLLRRWSKNPNLASLYGLNPLAILELTGNIHYEAVMIFFALLALWFYQQKRWRVSTFALALSIGTKLLPVLFFPLMIRYMGWKRGLVYATVTLGFTGLLFVPFIDINLIRNVFSSLSLYFQKLEFNASIYYIIRAVGYVLSGRSIIKEAGPYLSVLIAVGTIAIAVWSQGKVSSHKLSIQLLLTLSLYWLLATTVHPWYITSLLAVGLFTPFRYPFIWSGLAILSYGAYQTNPYNENIPLVFVEYGILVGYGIFEWKKQKNKLSTGE